MQWELIQEERRQRMNDSCVRFPVDMNKKRKCDLFYLLVDDRNKVLFCFIPKVASTGWRNTMASIYKGKDNVSVIQGIHNPKYMRRLGLDILSSYNKTESDIRLQTYKTFLFVRNPFERLVSAYRDKFEDGSNSFFNEKHGKKIVQLYRQNSTKEESNDSNNNVTFSELVQYALDGHGEPHWSPYQDHCCLCRVKYQYVGKFETLHHDTTEILQKVYAMPKSKANSYFPLSNKNVRGQTGPDRIQHYLRQLSPEQLADLNKYYQKDIYMFGYDHTYIHV